MALTLPAEMWNTLVDTQPGVQGTAETALEESWAQTWYLESPGWRNHQGSKYRQKIEGGQGPSLGPSSIKRPESIEIEEGPVR
jgi:hypothetical protein